MAIVCMTEASEINACVINYIFLLKIGPAYHRVNLRDGTGIGVQYYIYCSNIHMLQTGIGFKALRGGTKMPWVLAHLHRTDRDRTSGAQQALWTRREMIAA